MKSSVTRRQFIQLSAAAGASCLAGKFFTSSALAAGGVISPGCRTSKVKVAKLYLGHPGIHWPKPDLDLEKEVRAYEAKFADMKDRFADVDFTGNQLVTTPDELNKIKQAVFGCDGILVIHLSMGVGGVFNQLMTAGKPTMIFATPYSGHEWVQFGQYRKQYDVDCILSNDYSQLADAVRPIRAIHHLKNAKILNVTTHNFTAYAKDVKDKFGTEIKLVKLAELLDKCESIPKSNAVAEADRWTSAAEKIVEPPRDEIVKSCRLALAFEKMLDEQNATAMTVDCYGSMYEPLCKSYAFPCIGFTRLNDIGLAGICESDLRSAMTHIIFQGLVGKPGFINDPTVDESQNSIILAHCLGSTKMDGPDGAQESFKIRTIMERQEGAVCQVKMQKNRQSTSAILAEMDLMPYFTGEIIDTPIDLEDDRGCRTKITVRVDGDAQKLWQNWQHGLHRVTCYDNIEKDLQRFCKLMKIKLYNEAV